MCPRLVKAWSASVGLLLDRSCILEGNKKKNAETFRFFRYLTKTSVQLARVASAVVSCRKSVSVDLLALAAFSGFPVFLSNFRFLASGTRQVFLFVFPACFALRFYFMPRLVVGPAKGYCNNRSFFSGDRFFLLTAAYQARGAYSNPSRTHRLPPMELQEGDSLEK